MIEVPNEFQPHIKVDYPPNNRLIFEEWFYNQWPKESGDDYQVIELGREYLPIFWTSYFVNNNYGQDRKALQKLQDFINSLDKSKKYFTIVQYDDGILNDVSGIDLKVFGMGGGHYDYPLPLTAQPHPYSFTTQRDIFCNFMGAINHDVRRKLIPVAKKAGYFVNTAYMPIQEFCFHLSKSVFTLCPRGYGVTSFRLMEAVQYGSIPVYISDRPMIPHNKGFDYGVLIEPNDIPNIDRILRAIPQEEIEFKQMLLPSAYNNLFTYEACKQYVLENI